MRANTASFNKILSKMDEAEWVIAIDCGISDKILYVVCNSQPMIENLCHRSACKQNRNRNQEGARKCDIY